jgi:hypothetical protein
VKTILAGCGGREGFEAGTVEEDAFGKARARPRYAAIVVRPPALPARRRLSRHAWFVHPLGMTGANRDGDLSTRSGAAGVPSAYGKPLPQGQRSTAESRSGNACDRRRLREYLSRLLYNAWIRLRSTALPSTASVKLGRCPTKIIQDLTATTPADAEG